MAQLEPKNKNRRPPGNDGPSGTSYSSGQAFLFSRVALAAQTKQSTRTARLTRSPTATKNLTELEHKVPFRGGRIQDYSNFEKSDRVPVIPFRSMYLFSYYQFPGLCFGWSLGLRVEVCEGEGGSFRRSTLRKNKKSSDSGKPVLDRLRHSARVKVSESERESSESVAFRRPTCSAPYCRNPDLPPRSMRIQLMQKRLIHSAFYTKELMSVAGQSHRSCVCKNGDLPSSFTSAFFPQQRLLLLKSGCNGDPEMEDS